VIVKDPLNEPLVTVKSLPAGCAERGGTVFCNAGTLAAGETKTFHITVTVAGGLAAGTQVSDCAQATSATTLLNHVRGQASCIQTVIVAPETADLSITKAGPADIGPNGTYSYTLTATNHGPDTASDVVVTDPTDPSLVTVTSVPAGCTEAGGTVTCPVGTLAAGDSRTFTITVQVNPGVRGVVIPNCAQDHTSTEDPDLDNNQSCVNTAVSLTNPPQSDITVVKHGPAVVHPGGTITYTVDVTNNGPDNAAAVVITDQVPPSLAVTALPAGCTLHGSSVECLAGGLAVGETRTLTFTETVATDAVPGTEITNCANAGSQRSEVTLDRKSACAQTVVLPRARTHLSITKTAPAEVRPGGTIRYTVSVTNRGPSAADDVTIKDPLPDPSLVTITSLPSGCTVSSGTVTCDLGTLEPGETRKLTIEVRVRAGVDPGTVIGNCADAYSTTSSPDLANSQSCASTVVRHMAGIKVVKRGPATVHPGETADYTVTVTNRGPDTAVNVVIKDHIDESLLQVTSLPAGCSLAGGTVSCRAGTLRPGQSKTFRFTVKVRPAVKPGTRIENCATVSSDRTVLRPAVPRSCTVATVRARPRVPVTG
jgi:uncharacterized repeat protein (TIGR01451 family)